MTSISGLWKAVHAAGMRMALSALCQKDWRLAAPATTLPVNGPLQSLAIDSALYGFAKCPHFWAKTPHRT